jgi:5,10-methylenetetrahydromethanopterin reductase
MGSAGDLGMGRTPQGSALTWLAQTGQPKVPLDVACTGPRVISLAARHAERLTVAVGAEPERLRWAVETARRARSECGRDPSDLSVGAWVSIAPHEDIGTSRRLVAGGLSAFGRISALRGNAVGPRSEEDCRVLDGVRAAYDMNRHAEALSPQAQALSADFIDRNALVGPAKACVRRLEEMIDLGIERFVFSVAVAAEVDRAEARHSNQLLADEVLPALR